MFQIDKPLPKISCLMVTANGRFEYFLKSCKSYFDQTYSNKELVIVNEGSLEYQKQIEEHLSGRDDVRFVFLDGKYSLGCLRNISVAMCYGDIFVQWDDDDFNMPERLSVQYAFLNRHSEADVCYFSDQLHYYFPTKQLYWNDWARFHGGNSKKYSLIPGTIMAYKKSFNERYPTTGAEHCCTGEDHVLSCNLLNNDRRVVLMGGYGYLNIYSYHGKNVYDLNHHTKISTFRSVPIEYLNKNRSKICQTIDYLKLEGETKVIGRDGLAFIHGETL